MELLSYSICAPGLVRLDNQDNLYINGEFRRNIADNSVFKHSDRASKRGLYAVADGMGGETHGELASLITVQAMNTIKTNGGVQGIVQHLIERNAIICDLINRNGGARIGSTFVGIYINGKNVEIINIGDSRAYLMRGGAFMQISRDHSSIQQMIDLGVLTKEAAHSHPDRHRLTQHLGIFPHEMVIEPYTASMAVEAGDIFLMCSDGLTDMLDDPTIGVILQSSGEIEQKAQALYSAALQRGGKDNITILLVQVKKGGLFG